MYASQQFYIFIPHRFNHRLAALADTLSYAAPSIIAFGCFFFFFLNTFVVTMYYEYEALLHR